MLIQDIQAIIGVDAAHHLMTRIGGLSFYIPRKPKTNSLIALAIGMPLAIRLCNEFHGETISLDSRLARQRTNRVDMIIFDLRRGVPSSECASRHGVTVRYVNKLKRMAEK